MENELESEVEEPLLEETVDEPTDEVELSDDSDAPADVVHHFTAAQVEEMASALLVGDIVGALAEMTTDIDEKFSTMSNAILSLETHLAQLREENEQLADFAADSELALHRVQGFKDVSEVAAPKLGYASAIKELGLSGHITLNASTTPVKVIAEAVVADEPEKVMKLSRLKVGEGKTRQQRVAANATRMHSLLS